MLDVYCLIPPHDPAAAHILGRAIEREFPGIKFNQHTPTDRKLHSWEHIGIYRQDDKWKFVLFDAFSRERSSEFAKIGEAQTYHLCHSLDELLVQIKTYAPSAVRRF